MKENKKLKTYLPSEIENLRVIGRTTPERNPLNLFWTGSGIELCTKGSELWVEFQSGFDTLEPWISVFINNTPISRMMLPAGKQNLCIFRGFRADTAYQVRILRESQAMPDDEDCFLQISGISFDGEFLPLPKRNYKLEFIGDSITSGEGLAGPAGDRQWIPMYHSVIGHYALLTADTLNAEYSILSQGGYGVLAGWDNNPNSAMPNYYEKICGVLHGEKSRKLGAFEAYDFSGWQPDAVIVNLGTNDDNAFHEKAWTDPESGKRFKLRMNSDGTYNSEDARKFKTAIADFLSVIRGKNPGAFIVWAYGMLGEPLWDFIADAVKTYSEKSGDRRVKVLRLPCANEKSFGANGHPGSVSHREAAETLARFLSGALASSI